MHQNNVRSLLAACSIVVALMWNGGTALAEGDGQGSQVYLGLGAGFGFENFDGTGGLDIDEAFGFDIWVGYRFVPLFATEVQLEYLNGFDAAFIDGQAFAFTGNAKLFPLAEVSDRVEPFLYAGIGVGWFEIDGPFGTADESDFIARFGGGIDLYLTESVAFQVSSSYVLTTGDLEDLDWISLVAGVQYRF